MITEISAAAVTVKQGFEIAQAIRDASKEIDIQAKTIEMQGVILALHEEIVSLRSRNDELVDEKRQLKAEIAEKEHRKKWQTLYHLKKYREGSSFLVYRYKKSAKSETPIHDLCAHCFHSGEKSILFHLNKKAKTYLVCSRCKFEVGI